MTRAQVTNTTRIMGWGVPFTESGCITLPPFGRLNLSGSGHFGGLESFSAYFFFSFDGNGLSHHTYLALISVYHFCYHQHNDSGVAFVSFWSLQYLCDAKRSLGGWLVTACRLPSL